ncbi:hypothetical protein SAMN04515674_101422 [Pseudarcicella hirudinis]|uniref:Glyoxalase-like domain-containing protein n=1 Tax=Pseudarcicella hirudinis TaxID=1079859 RepID=A0A1I5MRY9_9BACT|nr:hypothetical protein [Pseudarcicella hirudinis]SFP12313.1 hypothetical protein SAMN04515674_101422 [Pseudarcicella hirudinis]
MYKALYLSPMIPSYNIPETVRFFQNIFAFNLALDDSNYKILYKEDRTVHILRAGEHIGEMEMYLEVDNIDLLWETVKDQLKSFETKIREPFNREYGMREFHVVIPYTKALLFVGQVVK